MITKGQNSPVSATNTSQQIQAQGRGCSKKNQELSLDPEEGYNISLQLSPIKECLLDMFRIEEKIVNMPLLNTTCLFRVKVGRQKGWRGIKISWEI